MGTDLLLNEKEIREAADLLGEILVSYQADVADRRVLPEMDRTAIHRLLEEPFPEEPRSVRTLFDEFREVILPNSTHVIHPRFLAYILSSPHGLAPFAEALAATLNQSSSLWTISPAASAIEQKLISWFSELFHFPGQTAGIITSGGSMANLMALTVARDHRLGERAREDGLQAAGHPLTVYTSDQAHNSIDKFIHGLPGLARLPRKPGQGAGFQRSSKIAAWREWGEKGHQSGHRLVQGSATCPTRILGLEGGSGESQSAASAKHETPAPLAAPP